MFLLVIPARVELATYRLGGGCSILLSYGTIKEQYRQASSLLTELSLHYIPKTIDLQELI